MSTWNPGGPPPDPSGDQPNFGQQPPPPPAPPSYGQPPSYSPPPSYGAPPPPPPGQPYGSYPAAPPPPPNPYGYQPAGYAPVAQAAAQMVELPNVGVVKVATIGQRFLARLIDGAIYFVVAIIMFAIGIGSLAASSHKTCDPNSGFCVTTTSSAGVGGFLLSMAILFAFAFLYEWLFIAYKGQTLGKMAMGVKVLRQEDGQIPGFGKAFIREIIPWGASIICSLLGLLMYISVFFDNSGRNQTWYDKAATTQVISLK
jgi:uncharacterized RDD family membrane protein YckC